MTRAYALAAVLALGLLAGCGSEDEPAPEPRPVETVEKSPNLPEGWTRHTNTDGGFELGLPRGWKADDRGTTTRVRSFDKLVVLSIAPDRTNEALEADLNEFATATLGALKGYDDPLEPGPPHTYKHRYDGAVVKAENARAGDVKQDVAVIVLRRPDLAVFTIVEQANASDVADPARELAAEVIATLRSRPVT